ncbi:DEAD/DEAH box helicase family protein [Chitinimonas viridis]|uniref:DEAD/DEAH box helicase family protein n=1 Tax=Chitinimonas viridis TaxID=664880 RepID=A0ABT8B4D6_9NEIS|nr:DEAD/DEAH box helicase family protein [Chitinimonas viridis]MDN3576978.1 DEAD/DEAH box helicase family protein [Chitinimonas viridis]
MNDLFAEEAEFSVPELVDLIDRIDGNIVKRLVFPKKVVKAKFSPLQKIPGFGGMSDGFRSFAIVNANTSSYHGYEGVLRVRDVSSVEVAAQGAGKWLLPRPRSTRGLTPEQVADVECTLRSWEDAFDLRLERYEGVQLVRPGMRLPQVGAVRAVLAHWSVSRTAVTVVLPTGTGKTETMLALMVMAQIPRLLVIVPSDALRTQVSDKFLGLGMLKQAQCLADKALHPTVAILKHVPKSMDGLLRLVNSAHVVVTTMSLVAEFSAEMQDVLADWASHLFVDEAHHIAAATWREFKQRFSKRIILQFTATPYRNDSKRVDGRHIYTYPLRQAQQDGLFKQISYVPVIGLDRTDADDQIIWRVGECLRRDRESGRPHLAMARVGTIDAAKALHQKYVASLGEFNPQLIHSEMGLLARREALRKLREGESSLIVCVNMLGEGFDLPELKIAALHDKHKSEAITLQFVGRFTRSRNDLGDATVIANVAMDDVNERLKALYAEDADWNYLLNVVGFKKTFDAKRREDIITGLDVPPEKFHVANLQPRMSTIVYRTTCDEWCTDDVESAIGINSIVADGPSINPDERLLILVTRDEEVLPWTSMKFPKNVQFNLVMAYWNEEQGLLFINTSRKKDLHLPLANKLANDTAVRLGGDAVFRVLDGFDRLMLSNLGLSEAQRKPIRYSMFMGVDIADQLNAYAGNRTKTLNNLYGQGFVDIEDVDEDGEVHDFTRSRATLGCSIKGKIWSQTTTNNPAEWMRWCDRLGGKLLDDRITTEKILRNLVKSEAQQTIPKNKIPLAIDWPEDMLFEKEERLVILVGEIPIPFYDCEIELEDFTCEGGVRFRVGDDKTIAKYLFTIDQGVAKFSQISGPALTVRRGKKEQPLLEIFQESPPHVYMADGDMLVGSSLFIVPSREDVPVFDLERIETGGWVGVDIRSESQGPEKKSASIQRRVIEKLLQSGDWDLVFDDDGAGEVADVVAMKLAGNRLQVHLYHCKYSSETHPGARVADLYEICGQAQKSIRWAEQLGEMLKHLQRREADRLKAGKATRFERGNLALLVTWINKWRQLRADYAITLVQPGYSKRAADRSHLELLAATQTYLMDTYRIPVFAWFNE